MGTLMTLPLRRLLLLLTVLTAVAGSVMLATPHKASAHPLGRFAVNHYHRLDISEQGIAIFSVVDMAEIPAFQEIRRIDRDSDGTVSDDEASAYARSRAADIAASLALTLDGESQALTPVAQGLTLPEGEAGLHTLRLEMTLRSELPAGWRSRATVVSFTDSNDPDRLGWREIIVRGGAGVEVRDANVPAEDRSSALTSYPKGAIESAPDVRQASFAFVAGTSAPLPADTASEVRATHGNPDATLGRFGDLIANRELGGGAIALTLLAALGFGALHALSPGHGKTVVAAYLVGSRGTLRHALLLGLTVTATHTSSVYALGFVTLYLSEYVLPERLYPWLSVASGALIAAMGVALLCGRLRQSGLAADAMTAMNRALLVALPRSLRAIGGETGAIVASPPRPAHVHSHDAAHGDDARGEHRHGLRGAHGHQMPGADGGDVTWRQLVVLGVFGGLLPCPSAIVVMLSAISLHRVGLGLLLIVAFSAGLAMVLTSIGFALVLARRLSKRLPLGSALERRMRRGVAALALRAFPSVSAAVVAAAGVLITLRALTSQGFL